MTAHNSNTISAADQHGNRFEIHLVQKPDSKNVFLKLSTGEPVNDLGYGKYQVVRCGSNDETVLTKL